MADGNARRRTPNILVVDDDLFIRRQLRQALEEGGYAVAEADSGLRALKMISDSPPDLVILDVVMSGMDGFATCAGLRSFPVYRHLPVLMVTALEDPQTIEEAYAVGATDYIVKPINPPHLRHHVRYLLRAHQIYEELRKKEGRLAQAQRIAHLGNWEWFGMAHDFRLSEEGLRILGLPADKPVIHFQKFLGRIHPGDRELVENSFALAAGGRRFGLDFRLLLPDGTIRMVHGQGEPIADPYGRSRHLAGTIQDITDRKATEEKLRLSAKVFENSGEIILLIASDGEIIDVNPSFPRLTGYPPEALVGRKIEGQEFFYQDADTLVHLWNVVKGTGHGEGEVWGRRNSGETFPAWLSISAVYNSKEEPTHFVGVMTDLTKLRRSEERLQYLAHHDALTDLPNRQLIESILHHALERARREKRRLCLLIIDLDQFKVINDSYGHGVGDELLISAAQRLRGRVRSEDTLSRLAGDQFALVLENLQDYSDADILSADLHALFEAPFELANGHRIYLRASIGMSVYPQDGATAHDLIRGADAAVHLAKQRGGNQSCYCTAELNTQARIVLELQSALRQGLEREEFVLHYQPKVDLRSGRIVGAEALLRWQRPGHGLVPPMEFIPAAEKGGVIVPLGAWVIKEACRQMREWRDAGLGDISVAVNVSARQFRSGNIEEIVSAALEHHSVAPQRLMLELTESMLMDDPEEGALRIAGLRKIGVLLSLDDFGTGYSSLGYLSRFPIDELKIDRSFIEDIVTDTTAATIATSIIALAHRMRLNVVAEGVETDAQLGYLRQNGCDAIQGHYFSTPLPAEKFASLWQQGTALPVPQNVPDQPTLLIVDDEPGILSSIKRMLLDDGYRVITAETAREGLELLAQNPVQVVLTDLRMPNMGGAEFLARIKMLHPNTVRLVLSGFPDLATVTESVNEGALYKFVAKPWRDEELRAHIRDAFSHYERNVRPCRACRNLPADVLT